MLSEHVAGATSRRGFLARTGRLLLGVAGGGFVLGALKAQKAEAYHFCGHIYTTDSCPHPTGIPRIDSRGFPLRARDGLRVDDLGRVVDRSGDPVERHDQRGRVVHEDVGAEVGLGAVAVAVAGRGRGGGHGREPVGGDRRRRGGGEGEETAEGGVEWSHLPACSVMGTESALCAFLPHRHRSRQTRPRFRN